MKLIIELDDKDKAICEQYINGKLGDELGDYVNVTEIAQAIANGIPYDKVIDEVTELLENEWGYEGMRDDVARIMKGGTE